MAKPFSFKAILGIKVKRLLLLSRRCEANSGIYSSDGDDSDSDEADHADKTASPRDNTSQIEAMSIDGTTPLPRWQESRAKSRLIEELSNPMSDIHLLLGDNYGENNWKTVKFKQIHLT